MPEVGSATLEALENDVWEPPEFASNLVTTLHRLRKKPLDQFTTEDLRIQIGQGLSLPYLMPLALDSLEIDPC